MASSGLTAAEELQRRIVWQVSMTEGSDLDWWANLEAFMTPQLEDAREKNLWPLRYPEWGQFEYRVDPEPVMVHLETGVVRRLQRVVVLPP